METEHFWWWKKEREIEVAEVGFYSGIPKGTYWAWDSEAVRWRE